MIETTALRELGRIQVRIKEQLAKYDLDLLPPELVKELIDIVKRAEVILHNAAKALPRKD